MAETPPFCPYLENDGASWFPLVRSCSQEHHQAKPARSTVLPLFSLTLKENHEENQHVLLFYLFFH